MRSKIGHANLDVAAERLFVAAGNREGELIGAFLQHGGLADVHAGLVGFGREFDRLARAIGAKKLGGDAVGSVSGLCCGSERRARTTTGFAQFVAIAFDQQCAARGAAKDAALADVANEFRVEDFEIGRVDAAEAPQFAAADVEHLAGAVELAGEVHGPLAARRLPDRRSGRKRSRPAFRPLRRRSRRRRGNCPRRLRSLRPFWRARGTWPRGRLARRRAARAFAPLYWASSMSVSRC